MNETFERVPVTAQVEAKEEKKGVEVDEDGELKDPTFCPFCGIKEDELDNIYDQHYPILEELDNIEE